FYPFFMSSFWFTFIMASAPLQKLDKRLRRSLSSWPAPLSKNWMSDLGVHFHHGQRLSPKLDERLRCLPNSFFVHRDCPFPTWKTYHETTNGRREMTNGAFKVQRPI
ncbi:MAG: hypothetical protein P8N73_10665, partial [Pseudomonadales bacterium]|nr:hypothetical protein [Pseudomonadales bacterium]